ncbi:hypothetical protein SISSUDRAFT_924780 [Sistotremastrum suecicum HHB10207 ss-3]|uniref:Uncharacterized protein n=1 Tax=Sistotremastrum suecicum HHB10207 ss-3 TaxID=1314776 RepID=A0A166BVE6_9AGAM|nr:hypothetical protein SISSUDRAFT_924780 [Sistotremastrum suecicum HHB10207 ss-3]
MLGTATSTTGRTKIIVVEDGTVVAYDYLQGLTGLDYAQEQLRIMCDLVNAYQFLLDRGGSWRGGFRDILLTAKDQRLRIGGLGSIDDNWNDSGWRMWEAFKRVNGNWRLVGSFESYKSLFSEAKNSLERWKEDAKDENAQVLLDNLWLWSPSSLFEQPTNSIPLVGQIGWMEGQEWHIIPLSVPFEVANAPAYSAIADRLCGAEWDAVEGTQLDGFTRWSVRGFPGDKINLRTWVRSTCTAQIEKFFFASALPLAEEFGLKVSSLWFVSRAGFQIDASV